jgi:hypothetical protein
MKNIAPAALIAVLLSADVVSAQVNWGVPWQRYDFSAQEQQQRFNDMEQWMRSRDLDAQLQRMEQQRRLEEFNRRNAEADSRRQRCNALSLAGVWSVC